MTSLNKAGKKPINSELLAEVLDDLCMRFIVNLPSEEFESFARLFFAIEAAHWFYDDFYREKDSRLPRLALKPFAARLFERTQLLSGYRGELDRLVAQFQAYKQEVPTCGAALLNSTLDRVVLVRGWGRDARWGFPKGKLAKNETELQCAIREVEEEIGFDISPYVDESTYAIDSFVGDRYARIYVVPGIPEDVEFVTKTRKEISGIEWVSVNSLPDSVRAAKQAARGANAKLQQGTAVATTTTTTGFAAVDSKGNRMLFAQHSFAPFTKRLHIWIKRQKFPTKEPALPHLPLPLSSSPQPLDTEQLLPSEVPSHSPLSTSRQQRSQTLELKGPRPSRPPDSTAPPRKRAAPRNPRKSPGASPPPRRRVSEMERNRATFGDDTTVLNNDQRRRLFQQYVVEADRLTSLRETGRERLNDDWPVPYVTSRDFPPDQRRAAEHAAEKARIARLNAPLSHSHHTGDHSDQHAHIGPTRADPPATSNSTAIDKFTFDRNAIMASMTLR